MAQARAWLWGLVLLVPLGWALEHGHLAGPPPAEPLPLWPWLFAAVVLGLFVGAVTWRAARGTWVDRPVQIVLALVALAALLAIAGWPAGRLHTGLVLSLWIFGAYALGCVFGWGLRETAEVPALPVATRALAATRDAALAPSFEPSPFGRPPYLSKPGREPFFVPGSGIADVRAAAAAAAARDAAAGIVRPPAPAVVLPPPERPRYLSKPGREPFYLPGAGVTDPRTAMRLQAEWRAQTRSSPAPASTTPPVVTAPVVATPAVETSAAAPVAFPVAPPPAAAAAPPASVAPVDAPPLEAPAFEAPPLDAAPLDMAPLDMAPSDAATSVPALDEPAPAPPVPNQDRHPGERPPGLVSARGASPDRLQRIKGVGPKNEVQLNGLGVWHFAQIAEWTPAHVTWVGSYLAFPGRIERERWIEQAIVLAAGGVGAKDNPQSRIRRPRA